MTETAPAPPVHLATETAPPNHLANHQPSRSDVQIKSATPTHLSSLPAIFNHYISTTVISFRLEPVTIDLFNEVLASTKQTNLPFIVATLPPHPSPCHSVEKLGDNDGAETIIGYAYAFPFRVTYPAYRHTVEISVYLHPSYQSLGVGSALMDVLMEQLRTVHVPDPTGTDTLGSQLPTSSTNTEGPGDGSGRIRQVLSIMSIDTEGRDSGLALERFYARWGFTRAGHIKEAGFKFGRWIDVLFLQATL